MKTLKSPLNTIFTITAIILLTTSYSFARETEAQKYLSQMAEAEGFNEAVIAAMAITSDGDTLLAYNSDKMLVPASTMKLVTTGTALNSLGASYRWETAVGYIGTVRDGELCGDVIIIGEGDPLLGSKDSLATPVQNIFAQWRHFIGDAGIRRISGSIVGDGRWFDGPRDERSWLWEDIGTDYGTGTSGLNFYENMQDVYLAPGKADGDNMTARPGYPLGDILEVRNLAKTGGAGTGDKTYWFPDTSCGLGGYLTGTYGFDRAARTAHWSNRLPEFTCAREFAAYLKGCGVDCDDYEGLKSGDSDDRETEPVIIGRTKSNTLDKVAFAINHASNNFMAETVFRTMGKRATGSACYDSCRVEMERELVELGTGSKGINITDGSGLSRKNLMSPSFMCRFLGAMMDSPAYEDFLRSLPQPGSNGTMKYRMSSYPQELKSRIRYKSGSMEGVRCFAGYILPDACSGSEEDGKTIIFSIMVNNTTLPNGSVQTLIDRTIEKLSF